MCLTEGCDNKVHDHRGLCFNCLGYNKKCEECGKRRAWRDRLCKECHLHSGCTKCQKHHIWRGELCQGCHPDGKCKKCKKNQKQKDGLCMGCHPDCKCTKCNKNIGIKDGLCLGCHPEGKCTECKMNIRNKDGFCPRCHPEGKCTECKTNIMKKDGLCYTCHPEGHPKCPHGKIKQQCQICDPIGHLANITRSRLRCALMENKTEHTVEYVGCTTGFLRKHLTKQFEDGMTWENYGKVWHIDHIEPIKFENPTEEKLIKRLHYTNLQPLGKEENLKKGNRYVG